MGPDLNHKTLANIYADAPTIQTLGFNAANEKKFKVLGEYFNKRSLPESCLIVDEKITTQYRDCYNEIDKHILQQVEGLIKEHEQKHKDLDEYYKIAKDIYEKTQKKKEDIEKEKHKLEEKINALKKEKKNIISSLEQQWNEQTKGLSIRKMQIYEKLCSQQQQPQKQVQKLQQVQQNKQIYNENSVFVNTKCINKMDIKEYLEHSINETITYDMENSDMHINLNTKHKGIINVSNKSSLCAAKYYSDNKNQIAVLNFANAIIPGAGYLDGRDSQEGSLCKQSLLYPTLVKNQKMYEYNVEHNLGGKGSNLIIYSPKVLVFRDDGDNILDKPYLVNFITSPAVDCRGIGSNEKISVNQIMSDRIRKIINFAVSQQNNILILGAFGCGVYKNDPNDIANIFQTVLIKEGFSKYFDHIEFAIMSNGPSDDKLDAFKAVFS